MNDTGDTSRGAPSDDRILDEVEALTGFHGDEQPLDPPHDLARRRAVNAALSIAHRTETVAHGRRRLARISIAASMAAAAVVAIALFARSRPSEDSVPSPRAAMRGAAPIEDPAPASLELLAVVDAQQAASGLGAPLTRLVEEGARLGGDDTPVLLGVPGEIEIEVAAHSRVVLARANERDLELSLEAGRVLIAVDPLAARPRVVVSTSAGDVRVKGTVFSVAVEAEDVAVEVYRGAVLLERASGRSSALEAGRGERITDGEGWEVNPSVSMAAMEKQSRTRGILTGSTSGPSQAAKPGASTATDIGRADGKSVGRDERPRGARESTRDLLSKARERRLARDWAGCAAFYEEIVRAFPASDEAKSALVSLGTLRLRHLRDPAGALVAFDGYLAAGHGGALGEEALFGKAEAFRALGRTDEERSALRSFERRYPDSLRAKQASRRLEILGEHGH